MKLCLLLCLLLQLAAITVVRAQSIRISGFVKDENGLPMKGATISVKGANTSALTDSAGNYVITAPGEQSVLIFSYSGYEKIEARVDHRSRVDIRMQISRTSLDDVVVVGYGTQKKADLTGAIATVSGADLNKRVATDPTQLLQGKLPGLSLTQASGEAGNESPTLLVRGYGSYGSSNSPLVIVDGLPGSLTALDPQNIASVTLLKDAASAAIYGSRAANGVILVTTKQGAGGKFQLSYDYNIGITKATALPNLDYNSLDYMTMYNQAATNSGSPTLFTAPQIAAYTNPTDKHLYPSYNWLKAVMQTVDVQTHHLGLTGGHNGTTYNVGLGFVDQPDVMIGFAYKKYNLQFNLTSKINDKITFGSSLTLNYSIRSYPEDGSQDLFLSTLSQSPLYGPVLPDGSGRYTAETYPNITPNKNPVAVARTANSSVNDFFEQGNVYLNVKLAKGLEWKTSGGFNFDFQKTYVYKPVVNLYYWQAAPNDVPVRTLDVGGQGLSVNETNYIYPVGYTQLTYDTRWKDHHFKLLGGTQTEYYKNQSLGAARVVYPDNSLQEINAGSTGAQSNSGSAYEWSLLSYYGRFNYDFENKYLLEANARYDASSRFPPANRWAFFPSVSLGWVASREHFLENIDFLSNLKLRGSWGTLGNQNIGNYPYQNVYVTGSSYPYTSTGLTSGAVQTALTDQTIKWETTRVFDFGADLSVFKNRLSLTFDWYNKLTYGILAQQVLPAYIGLTPPTVNNGKMRNTGIEVSAQYSDHVGEFSYSVGGTLQANKNVLVKYGPPNIGSTTIDREGQPYGSFYLYEYAGIFQSTDEIAKSPYQPYKPVPGTFKFKDLDGNDSITANDRAVVSGIFPKYEYSFNVNAGWKNFDLTVFFYGSQGQKQYVTGWGIQPFDQGSVPTKDWLNAWTPQHPSTTLPLLYITGTGNVSSNISTPSTYYLKDASFLRIKNVQLGYNLPSRMARRAAMSALRLYFAADNLLTFTKFPGLDPERVVTNGRYVAHPQNKVFSFGVRAVF
ncbi:SusC/RagA family TonB-linked outer membrane protein [Puia dinghuensis]|uniref:SusC/RagA family TonB-linked outer membrane protein n=1 Tax=Puia dinghuensis TaxID=1792502 RepID=A0A8J2U9X6_9BACT|nr:TonB-dependent receptor [Puia dinghuensis]GGA89461.1 SusC/RagA family TonB-linked outer membrane protein [Puia dinghuensis]